MHACIACGTEMMIQLCCHSLRLNKIVHYARQYGTKYHDRTLANECFEVQFTHIREESQTSSQLHAWKVHDELRDLLPVQVYQLH